VTAGAVTAAAATWRTGGAADALLAATAVSAAQQSSRRRDVRTPQAFQEIAWRAESAASTARRDLRGDRRCNLVSPTCR
jgi:hypothetical protein